MTKKVHLEILRFIAVCLVVFNHTDGYFWFFTETNSKITYFVSLFFSVLCRINVPLFFMISGALLIRKEEDIPALLKKRVARIVMVIFLFSAVQYIAAGIAGKADGRLSIGNFFKAIYSGSVIESYWFLYSYLAVLILLPFLRKMARGMSAEEFRYLFMLKIIMDIGLRLITVFNGTAINLELFILADNVFYLLFGYYMEHVLPEKWYQKPQVTKAAAVCGFTIFLAMAVTIAAYKMKGAYSQSYLGIFNPILVIMVYYIVKSICISYPLPEKMQNAVIYLGSTVFGIYLIEQLVRRQLLPVYLYLCEYTAGLIACFIYVIGTVTLAIIYVSILKKVPGIRKLI